MYKIIFLFFLMNVIAPPKKFGSKKSTSEEDERLLSEQARNNNIERLAQLELVFQELQKNLNEIKVKVLKNKDNEENLMQLEMYVKNSQNDLKELVKSSLEKVISDVETSFSQNMSQTILQINDKVCSLLDESSRKNQELISKNNQDLQSSFQKIFQGNISDMILEEVLKKIIPCLFKICPRDPEEAASVVDANGQHFGTINQQEIKNVLNKILEKTRKIANDTTQSLQVMNINIEQLSQTISIQRKEIESLTKTNKEYIEPTSKNPSKILRTAHIPLIQKDLQNESIIKKLQEEIESLRFIYNDKIKKLEDTIQKMQEQKKEENDTISHVGYKFQDLEEKINTIEKLVNHNSTLINNGSNHQNKKNEHITKQLKSIGIQIQNLFNIQKEKSTIYKNDVHRVLKRLNGCESKINFLIKERGQSEQRSVESMEEILQKYEEKNIINNLTLQRDKENVEKILSDFSYLVTRVRRLELLTNATVVNFRHNPYAHNVINHNSYASQVFNESL